MKKDLLRQNSKKTAHPHHKFLGTFLGKFIKWGAPLPKIRISATEKAVFKILPKNQTENQTGVPESYPAQIQTKKIWAALPL